MAERPVVRYDQQPLGVLIQPSDRKQATPLVLRKKPEHCRVPRVPTRRDHTGGLIEHVIPLRAVALHLPVHRNRRSLRIELGRRIADHLPFHRHTAGADERLHFFPAAAIEVGEQFIQTHLGHLCLPTTHYWL